MPIGAEASFISSLLGKEVLASTNLYSLEQNSQNGLALEANVSSFAMIDDKKADSIDFNVEVGIVADTALLPVTGPLGVSDGSVIEDFSSVEEDSTIYVIRSGDTFSKIAEMFEVSVDTILSVNDIKPGEKPVVGDILLILPITGIQHTVEKGQTLKGLASTYNVDINDIISYNIDINVDSKLVIGDKLIIPGASMLKEKKIISTKNIAKSSGGVLKSTSGYFINPLPSGPRIRKTQGIHDRYAIDVGAPTGTPIYAAAAGTVTFAKEAWNGAYGYAVFIKHPNGAETRYAHMSDVATTPGKQVAQGELIGYVGSTGRSTGPHLHYEVRNGFRNNLAN
ncbi:MAG: peptidoglycan DD-metalloendopeptidase family protein [Candidatus Pacebacteria bacterium]|nr:peptidoglycan DD-metalloendopeptidase family protein [Candidatus Paceibacterota bacterium]